MNKKKMLSLVLALLLLVNVFCGVPTANVRADAAGTAPVPSNLTATANSGGIALSWDGDAIAADSSNGYILEVSKDGGAYQTVVNYTYATASQSVAQFTYAYIPKETGTYNFKVTGIAGSNKSSSVVTSTPVNYPSWQFRVFGSSTNTTDNTATVSSNNIVLESKNDKGKISSTADGIAFYYTQIDVSKPFHLTSQVHVDSVTANNQVSFGLMLRNTVGDNGSTAGHLSNFVAVGALNQKMQAFYRKGASLSPAIDVAAPIPKAGNDYTLSIVKTSDNKFMVSCGSDTKVLEGLTSSFTGSPVYLGLFTARNTKVTFSNVKFVTEVSNIAITGQPAKTEYFAGQDLDLSGLGATATYTDGSTKALAANDYIVSGFNKDVPGEQTVTVSYGGQTAAFTVNVLPLVLTGIHLVYTPAKTTYYLGDPIDTLGMVVEAVYNSGVTRALTASEYTLSGFDSSTPGEKTITVTFNADPTKTATFKITVKASELQGIEITRQPTKTLYYLGDKLNLGGLVVSALYSDSKVMLQSNEYTVSTSGFDTATKGEKTVVISYKGKEITLLLTVNEKKLTKIEVTKLPRTTYTVGDTFDPAGIQVSKVYDNGDKEVLDPADYTVDSSAFNSSTPGTYAITVAPASSAFAPISFPVTVREKTTYTWKSIVFGQSTSLTNNTVTPSEPGTVNGSILLKAGSNADGTTGGKVTGAQDGISFYYTEIDGTKDNFVLSADIKVIEFAKPTPDNQEAFGLMARDAIGQNGNSAIFSSNVVAVGGYRGTTQAFVRTGVTSSLGNEGTVQTATTWSTVRPGSSNTYPNAAYRLTLEKTNSGYTASLTNSSTNTVTFYEPDALIVQDSKIYVGFYTARVATIEVSNVSFTVTAAETDAPRVLPPPTPVTPAVTVTSLPFTSKSDYTFKLTTNVNGTVTIKQGETVIATDMPITAKQVLAKSTTLAANSTTNFTATFTPDATQALGSYDRIVTHFAVIMKTYETPDGAIYVSPAGSSTAAGTKEDPLDLDTAVKFVKEGQTIYMLGGTYNRTAPVTIPAGNDGSAAALKSLAAYNGETVTIDFAQKSSGFALGGSYWHILGINVTGATGTGFIIGGNYNKVELCKTYANGNTGMQISRIGSGSRETWPSYNLVLNCESFDNRDSSENDADGFAAKLTCGEGNVFRGCISHNNIDDGWDLYTKAETGPIGVVVLEDCIAYNNGTLTDGYIGKGDKNGFKLGGEGIAVPHIIRNSIAFGNRANGFTSNSNPAVQAYNCVSYDNKGANITFTSYSGIPLNFVIDHFISYKGTNKDSYPSSAASDTNYFFDGTSSVNKSGTALKDSNFASLTPSLPYERNANGSIIWGSFLKFIPNTDTPTYTGGGTVIPQPVNSSTGSAVVYPSAGGTVSLGSDASIVIPSGALKENAAVTVKVEKVTQPPAAPAGANLLSPVYEFTVGGQNHYTFNPPITLTLKYDAAALDMDKIPAIHYYDETTSAWVNIGGTAADGAITVQVDHFTRFAVIATPKPIVLKDISGHWGKSYIEKLVLAGAVNGYTDGTFRPDETITRAEFVKLLVKSFNLTPQKGKIFSDTAEHWAKDSIATAFYYGIVKGYDNGSFGPDDLVTREQMTVMIVNAAKLSTTSLESSFADRKDVSDWAKNAVDTAAKNSIISGYLDNTFQPQGFATRAEAVTLIVKALK